METKIEASAGNQNIVVKRIFNASIAKVKRAFSEPSLLEKWLMPENAMLQVIEHHLYAGGRFQFNFIGPQGNPCGFVGFYHEVNDNKWIRTSEFSGLPIKLDPVLEILSFAAITDTQTEACIHIICPSEEYRDGMVKAHMQRTFDSTHKLLDQLLEKL